MGRLQTEVTECDYRDPNRPLTEQFIGGINDDDMTDERLREIRTLEHIEEATGQCMLSGVHRMKA